MNRKQLISQMYWKERAIAVSNQAHKRADKMEEGMLKALRLAESRIKRDIQSWYSKFAIDNEISMSEARKLLTEAELAEFKWTVDEYIELAKQYAGFGDPDWERRLANASARVHIQRLEALQLQIRAEIERATNEQQMIMSNGIPLIYEESYNKTLEALGETAAMSRVNTKAIEKIAEKPWTTDGKTFSGRIWENKEKLVNSLQTDLIQAVTRGDTHAEMTNRLAERMNTSRYNAGRLVRTETTYINARATQDAYKENNVEKVEIIGTLDSRVCALCSDMDGITIDMKTYEPGVTVPPFHPMCRCTTAPAVEDIPDDIFEQLDDMMGYLDDIDAGEKYAYKSSGYNTVEDLKKVSQSSILNMQSFEEIENYFFNEYGIRIIGFPGQNQEEPDKMSEEFKKNLEKMKITFSGVDDVINKFPETKHGIISITYKSRIRDFGRIDSVGRMEIGKLGLGDYGTGVHEAIHGLDFILSDYGTHSFSESIVSKALSNLKLRKGGKETLKKTREFIGSYDEATILYEVFSYAIETEMGLGEHRNILSKEIYKVLKEVYYGNITG